MCVGIGIFFIRRDFKNSLPRVMCHQKSDGGDENQNESARGKFWPREPHPFDGDACENGDWEPEVQREPRSFIGNRTVNGGDEQRVNREGKSCSRSRTAGRTKKSDQGDNQNRRPRPAAAEQTGVIPE